MSGASWWEYVGDTPRKIGWDERRDGALAGSFFGAIGAVLHLIFALVVGLAGWWRDSAPTLGQFLLSQLAYSGVIVVGGGVLGALWNLRVSRAGRLALWLIGAAVVSGAMISLLKGPIWSWDTATWGWLLLMTPAFAWVLASGRSKPRAGRSDP